jgi:hypothetical protein
LFAAFVLSLRSAIGSKPPFTATISPALGDSALRVVVTPTVHSRPVVVDSIAVSRGAVEHFGLLPPRGFEEIKDAPIAFEDFEGDLSELAADATDSQIDDLRRLQYTDYLNSQANSFATTVNYRGRLPLSLHSPVELLFPCRVFSPTTGNLSLIYNCRYGLLRQIASVTTSFEFAEPVG